MLANPIYSFIFLFLFLKIIINITHIDKGLYLLKSERQDQVIGTRNEHVINLNHLSKYCTRYC